jgi:hypothetical protein
MDPVELAVEPVVAALRRDGYAHIPGVLGPAEVAALREQMDALLDDPVVQARVDPTLVDTQFVQKTEGRPHLLRNTIALSPLFLALPARQVAPNRAAQA